MADAITQRELRNATSDLDERARRQDRLQRAEATFEPVPFDAEAARAYGVIYAAALAAGRIRRSAAAVHPQS